MYIVIVTTLIALLLTYFESNGKMRNGMLWGVILLTTLGVIHFNYGNDYKEYYHIFHEVIKYPLNFDNIMTGDLFRDPGWVILCHFFNLFGGFFVMVAVLNIIQNVIVYRFIKFNVSKKWWALSLFVYTMSTNLYLMNFSMMRQGFVVCVFLGLWNFIKNKKWWWPLLVLYLCSYIHVSALLLIPFSFWGVLPKGKGKMWAVIFCVLFFILWFSSDFLNTILISFMDFEEFQRYIEIYENDENTATYGIGFIMNLIPFFVALYYLMTNKDADYNQKIVLLSMISFIIAPFSQLIPLISRIGTYFSIYKLAALPLIYNSIGKVGLRYGLLLVYVVMTLYDYWLFFNLGVFVKDYRVFHTIFEVIM